MRRSRQIPRSVQSLIHERNKGIILTATTDTATFSWAELGVAQNRPLKWMTATATLSCDIAATPLVARLFDAQSSDGESATREYMLTVSKPAVLRLANPASSDFFVPTIANNAFTVRVNRTTAPTTGYIMILLRVRVVYKPETTAN
jgi:hypothetical protein